MPLTDASILSWFVASLCRRFFLFLNSIYLEEMGGERRLGYFVLESLCRNWSCSKSGLGSGGSCGLMCSVHKKDGDGGGEQRCLGRPSP